VNTPKQIKRWSGSDSLPEDRHTGPLTQGVKDLRYLVALGAITVQFGTLELHVNMLCGQLLVGGPDPQLGGTIMEELISFKVKLDLLTSLLEKLPRNKDRGPEYDDIITKLRKINLRRNGYVHGLWYTAKDGSTWLGPTKHNAYNSFFAKEVSLEELSTFLTDLVAVRDELLRTILPIG
jgi:hypothetical protein